MKPTFQHPEKDFSIDRPARWWMAAPILACISIAAAIVALAIMCLATRA